MKTRTREAQAQTLEERLRARYAELPSSERAIGQLILEYPGDILLYTATALALRAKVSKAAVTRLVKRLGYSDYKDMQREARAAQDAGKPIYLNTSLATPPEAGNGIQRHLNQDLLNLRQTWDAVRGEDLQSVVRCALQARRVRVVGVRNSYFFASYLRQQLTQILPDVTVLPSPGQVPVEDLSSLDGDDLAIVIGLRRRTIRVRHIMEVLRDRGTPIAYVTDRVAVTTPKLATWVFPCYTRGTSLFDSYVGVISVLNYLCTEVAAQAGEAGRDRLGRIETLIELLHELDPSI